MIIFKNVSKEYSKDLFKHTPPALQDITFSLDRGRTLGLIGANGAGKSTSIRLIMDFIRPTRGTIKVFNKTPANTDIRERIGYLPETANFPPNLTIHDLITFTGRACKLTSNETVVRGENLLQMLSLAEVKNKPLRTYSKGMQQRANFVLALLNDPELLILDEPMSGLDPIGRGLILSLIHDLKTQGKTILFCSHILADVDRLADDLLILHKGKILYLGAPNTLIEKNNNSSIEEAYISKINDITDESHNFKDTRTF